MNKTQLFLCLIGLHQWFWIKEKDYTKEIEEGHYECVWCRREQFRELVWKYKDSKTYFSFHKHEELKK